MLHSDGISTKWFIENYPGLLSKRATIIAAVIYRDAVRGNDDASVVVAKQNRHTSFQYD